MTIVGQGGGSHKLCQMLLIGQDENWDLALDLETQSSLGTLRGAISVELLGENLWCELERMRWLEISNYRQ